MYIVRPAGSQAIAGSLARLSSLSITSTQNTWMDVPGTMAFPVENLVDGYKLRVIGSSAYTLSGSGLFNNSGCQIRVVRNSAADVLATGPVSAFSANSSVMDPVVVNLEDGDLVWFQVLKNTSLSRTLNSSGLDIVPVA